MFDIGVALDDPVPFKVWDLIPKQGLPPVSTWRYQARLVVSKPASLVEKILKSLRWSNKPLSLYIYIYSMYIYI
jgi:hypothetical protein